MLDALHDSDAALRDLPPRGGRGEHGRRVREAHRPPGDRDRHPRPGRDARVGRRAHRVPGLDAADPARRPGRPGHDRPGGVPGDRLPRPCSAGSRSGPRRSRAPSACRSTSTGPSRPQRPAGRGRSCSRCRRTCSPRRSKPTDAQPLHAAAGPPGNGRAGAPARAARGREAAVRDRRRRRWTEQAATDFLAFAEANELPVGAGFRRQDYVDNASRVYAGHVGIGPDPKLAARVRDADLLLVVGAAARRDRRPAATRSSRPAGRTRRSSTSTPPPRSSAACTSRQLGIVSGSPQFAAAARALEPVDSSAWRAETEQAHADHLASMEHAARARRRADGRGDGGLRERLPEDAILTNGAGNFSVWAHRFYEFRRFPTQLAPTSGAMGYGVPAAVAAKLVHPDRVVVCFAGDGDFLMSGQELATAVQYELPIVVLVVNNGMYGTIRMHQERHYPGRVFGTDLVNPDFARYAEAFGGHGEVVERTEEFAPAFERAVDVRPARGDRAARRSGGDHAADDAERDPRARLARQVTDAGTRLSPSSRRAAAADPLARQAAAGQGPDRHRRDPRAYGSTVYAAARAGSSRRGWRASSPAAQIVVRQANLHEFAWGCHVPEPPGTGRCRTRRSPGENAGGSSGGNAAALAPVSATSAWRRTPAARSACPPPDACSSAEAELGSLFPSRRRIPARPQRLGAARPSPSVAARPRVAGARGGALPSSAACWLVACSPAPSAVAARCQRTARPGSMSTAIDRARVRDLELARLEPEAAARPASARRAPERAVDTANGAPRARRRSPAGS